SIIGHTTKPVPPPTEIVPQLSPLIDAAVLKALAKRKEERFVNCREFANAFDNAINALRSVTAVRDDGEACATECDSRFGQARQRVPVLGKLVDARSHKSEAEARQGLSSPPSPERSGQCPTSCPTCGAERPGPALLGDGSHWCLVCR